MTITMSTQVSIEKTGWRRAKSNEYIFVTWRDIGRFFGVGPRQAARYHQLRGLPVAFIGRIPRAHKEMLMLWMARQQPERREE